MRATQPGEACAKCGHFACVCTIRARHKDDCKFRLAAACATPIECDHGRDVCSICDPCTCGAGVTSEDIAGAGTTDAEPVTITNYRVIEYS